MHARSIDSALSQGHRALNSRQAQARLAQGIPHTRRPLQTALGPVRVNQASLAPSDGQAAMEAEGSGPPLPAGGDSVTRLPPMQQLSHMTEDEEEEAVEQDPTGEPVRHA